MRSFLERFVLFAMVVAATFACVRPAAARFHEDEPEYKDLQSLMKEFKVGPYAPPPGSAGASQVQDVPDIFGPGAVLNVGDVFMKVTNYGLDGNPFPALSTDPSGQWPGASSVEYLDYIGFAVGAVNPLATDPTALRRVSYLTEWRPPTLDPVDRMYRAYDGIVNGQRFVDDDGDGLVDEDFLDGRDNDGDGKIDEDFGALGQEMYTCVMRDDTPQAINASATERHVPLGLEMRQSAWAYSIPGYTNFNVIQLDIYNRSGHTLDSVVIGFRTDMDCGPTATANYWTDDFNLPQYPHGVFTVKTSSGDLRRQDGRVHEDGSVNDDPHALVPDVSADSALCPRYKVRIVGWSTVDDNGDLGKTPGIGTVQIIDHTVDPTGANGPTFVGLHSFRSFPAGTPYASGGSPTIDQQRYEMMTSTDPGVTNVDPTTGFVTPTYITGDQKSDYSDWASIGPWVTFPDGGHLQATIAFEVQPGTLAMGQKYATDYLAAIDPSVNAVPTGSPAGLSLISRYPTLENALAAAIAFAGADESPPAAYTRDSLPDFHGRETAVIAPRGQTLYIGTSCSRDNDTRTVTEYKRVWFDFDCDYCTGSYSVTHGGYFHRSWLAESPPPSPNTNMAVGYNYSDNPTRRFVPSGDHEVTLAWDNLSETTADPKSVQFDFRGYKVWKVSNWQRPVGSGGPFEDDWTLLGDFRLFDAQANNGLFICNPDSVTAGKCLVAQTGQVIYPTIYVPTTGETKALVLHRGDLWNAQTGEVLSPDTTVQCQGYPNCKTDDGYALGQISGQKVTRIRYPVGRYHIVDHNVKNGFVYFYSVTAYDSTGRGQTLSMLDSRRSAVEAEGVVPQVAATTGSSADSGVLVVPNPYRGVTQINKRPSAWDLTPNATDPTGTHVDFFGLPRASWSIEIFTVSGDLVQTIHSTDPVNESIRTPVTQPNGSSLPGYNRQQDNPNDGQASWNLISRNGQDVVSGVYLFTVEVGGQVKHRGKFVIIR